MKTELLRSGGSPISPAMLKRATRSSSMTTKYTLIISPRRTGSTSTLPMLSTTSPKIMNTSAQKVPSLLSTITAEEETSLSEPEARQALIGRRYDEKERPFAPCGLLCRPIGFEKIAAAGLLYGPVRKFTVNGTPRKFYNLLESQYFLRPFFHYSLAVWNDGIVEYLYEKWKTDYPTKSVESTYFDDARQASIFYLFRLKYSSKTGKSIENRTDFTKHNTAGMSHLLFFRFLPQISLSGIAVFFFRYISALYS